MNKPITPSAPKVRPKLLLWTLLCLSLLACAFSVAQAWVWKHEVLVLKSREPAMRTSAEADKARIQIETDIEKLRPLARNYCESRLEKWQDYIYRLNNASEAMLLASVALATASIALGYSIYGLRTK